MSTSKLRIGYIPEHFSTPLHFAYQKHGLDQHATLRSFPSGTGTMIEAFQSNEIDVGIGLTEAWIVGLTKSEASEKPYHIVGAYTTSPLVWAISVGANAKLEDVNDLRGKKVGVSRMGSGSYIMSSVLAQKQGWLQRGGEMPFEPVVCGPFKPLRDAVNSGTADFFMWEHFTTKRWFDSGELKRVGEIPTPWNAWHIASLGQQKDPRVEEILLPGLQKGIKDFQEDRAEAVKFISENMEYSKEDADAWYDTVKFAGEQDMNSLNEDIIKDAVNILDTAGVLGPRKINSASDLKADSR